nr:retrovirus-related Pol polyprotein from transposon TNT 1-94 [Tanacetum cinerariifolium]
MAPIIEDWVSDSEDESEPNDPQSAPSFVQTSKHVKSSGHSAQPIEVPILDATPKPSSLKTNGSSKRKNRKTCFVCRSVDHLIKDCNFHKTSPTPRNYAHRGYNKQYASFTKNHPQKHIDPATVLTKSKPVYVTVVRPVSAAVSNIMVSRPRHALSLNTRSNSTITRHKTHSQSSKTSNSSPKVTVAKAQVVSAAKGKKGKRGNPQYALKDKGLIDSGCSRHMTWNMSYLSDFQELNRGYVSFGGNPKGGKILGNGKIKTDFKQPDESQVLLRVPRENNMYNVNLKDIVPSGDLTCLFAKATIDESNLWHRRLGHIHLGIFLTIKNETSPILNTFITGLENQLSLKVKVIRSDNGTEFKNSDLNQFYELKEIKREFSVPRTPQQNGIAERKNGTLIEAARTMLADSLLPIPFWVEAFNNACYVQNRVLVTKPQNKTPYELLHGRTPSIGFMRPFGCHVTILNTLDPLGKFERKVDEGFLVGYSVKSKAFRVFNSRTNIVQETLHVNFLENKPNVAGDATFDGKEHDAEKPESIVNLSPSSRNRDFNADFEDYSKDSSNDVSAVGPIVPAAGQNYSNNTNPISAGGPSNTNTSPTHGKSSLQDASQPPDMLKSEDIVYYDHENVAAEADFNNLKTSITVSPIPPTRIHNAHPLSQIIGNLSSTTQTRSMTRVIRDQGGI